VKPAPAPKPLSIDEHLRRLFPLGTFRALGKQAGVDVLIAGCGTGRHSTEIARRLKGTRILAVDLSLTSLGYAKRQTRALELDNIEYGQADILQLTSLGRSFDVIEAVGSLQTLAIGRGMAGAVVAAAARRVHLFRPLQRGRAARHRSRAEFHRAARLQSGR